MDTKMRLGFLASGKGSNIVSILDAIDAGQLNGVTPMMIISNTWNSFEISHQRKIHYGRILGDKSIRDHFQLAKVNWILCCGYLRKVGPLLLEAFPNKILNIHPSLLPKYGGKDMFGLNVHKAVLDAGDKVSGCTVHRINSEYDEGEIIGQATTAVLPGDTPESLQMRVFELEKRLYIEVLNGLRPWPQ